MPCVKALLSWRKMVRSQQTYDQKGLGRQKIQLLSWRKMVRSQQTYDQKGLGRQRNPPKKILSWVKRTISKQLVNYNIAHNLLIHNQ